MSGAPCALRLLPMISALRKCLAWRWSCAEAVSGDPRAPRRLPMVLRRRGFWPYNGLALRRFLEILARSGSCLWLYAGEVSGLAMLVRRGGCWRSSRAQASGDGGGPCARRLLLMLVRRFLVWRWLCAEEVYGGPRALRRLPMLVRRFLAWRWACAEELSGCPRALRLLPMVVR